MPNPAEELNPHWLTFTWNWSVPRWLNLGIVGRGWQKARRSLLPGLGIRSSGVCIFPINVRGCASSKSSKTIWGL